MLTVMEMLAHPAFKDFRIVTDRSGLNNRIRNAHILDWEHGDYLDDSFFPGDFVVTTLAACKDDPRQADALIDKLIRKNICCLAIKDIYISSLPERILDTANDHNIPIFMFSHSSTTDIIHALKSELAFMEINRTATHTMRKILYKATDGAEIDILARDINPFFSNNVICAFGMPVDFKNKESILYRMTSGYRDYLKDIKIDPEVSYAILFFSVGVCIIYTDQRDRRNMKDDLLNLIRQFSVNLDEFAVGFSDQMKNLSETGRAAKQAIYAAADAHINKESFKDYSSMGFTRVLCPLRSDYWMRSYYESLLEQITDYDEEHDSHLFETIADYVHCDGDINAAAEISYQHPNTIRYRIKKAQEILNVDNSMDFRIQLYTIVRLHEINSLLIDLRL